MNKMKLTTRLLLLMTLFVVSAIAFTACSSEEDVTSTEEQERGVVKTEFTISIPQGTSGTTRMAGTTVQSGENIDGFLGIRNIELYPFSSVISSTEGSVFPVTSTTIPSSIRLVGATGGGGKYGASGASDNTIGAGSTNLFTASKSHLYQDVDIPIGTKSFMFYGESARTGDGENAVYGALTKTSASSGTTLGDITFSPTPIHSSGEVGSNGTAIAAYLTSIANAKSGDTEWKDTKNVSLAALYENFISTHAGSWTSIKAMLQVMYTNLAARDADNNDTQAMKTAIRTAIANTTYGVSADTDGNLTFSQEMGNYPRDLGLPDGAAYVQWDTTGKKFNALANNHNTGLNTASLASYVYPASLYYRALSNIKTSTSSKGTTGTQAFDNDKTWETILGYYNQTTEESTAGYDNSKVSSKTRSIVIIDPVQYAVGRLDAYIYATSASLKDNANTDFTVNSGTNFPITAILVGGQKAVDYKFEQRTDATTTYTIYDNSIDGTPYLNNASPTTPIYMLALETKSATADAQEDAVVKIAVELENKSGKTIVGYNNEMIYPGCRFYLLGTLDPNKNVTQTYDGSPADATNHPELIIKKAFVQDYKTQVNLKIASLKNAYNTLPDLTLPQLEMGLFVDLTWKPGISQDITID